jgi:hypothetical protein
MKNRKTLCRLCRLTRCCRLRRLNLKFMVRLHALEDGY